MQRFPHLNLQVFYVNQEKNLKVNLDIGKKRYFFNDFQVICEWTGAGVTTLSSRFCLLIIIIKITLTIITIITN